ncbi:MAG: TPM domain-containing protein, partial [Betaproteobacteria bacterium]
MQTLGRRWLAGLSLWFALAALPSVAAAAEGDPIAIPPLRAHVTDLTGTLSASDRQALEQKLSAWETQKGAQFAVLLVPATKPESIDEYSQRVTDAWKIGRKGIDDG